MNSTYKIVHASSIVDLEKNVQGWIREGWEPLGGVTVAQDLILQAMIRGNRKGGSGTWTGPSYNDLK